MKTNIHILIGIKNNKNKNRNIEIDSNYPFRDTFLSFSSNYATFKV